MRLLISIWLSTVVLLINIQQSIGYGFFKANQNIFATEQCEMREWEGNSCQGSCVLRELLSPAPFQEKVPFVELELKVDEFVGFQTESTAFSLYHFQEENLGLFLSSISIHSLVFEIWRPPQL
jgi:hypothetical protein